MSIILFRKNIMHSFYDVLLLFTHHSISLEYTTLCYFSSITRYFSTAYLSLVVVHFTPSQYCFLFYLLNHLFWNGRILLETSKELENKHYKDLEAKVGFCNHKTQRILVIVLLFEMQK